jgi:hypothetical protein
MGEISPSSVEQAGSLRYDRQVSGNLANQEMRA